MPPTPDAHAVADAFGLAAPTGPLVPVRHVSSETWRLDTLRGRYFVKRLVFGDWRDQLEKAMAVELRARAAGLPTPLPVAPIDPAWGLAADLGDGCGVLRVHAWLDGAPLAPGTDLSHWYGTTLAALHSLQPAGPQRIDSMWPLWYGVYPPGTWDDWLATGLRQERPWAPLLKERLPLITDLAARIEAAYDEVGDYVLTHRDVVPHNVLMATGGGPVLIDWDGAGPDSATLETAAAVFDHARHTTTGDPDPARIASALATYRDHGGDLRPCGFLLARRLGVHLARCAERIRTSLGRETGGSPDPADADARTARQLAALPEFSSLLLDWSRRMG
ncbi:aminoglycoside phosphotransferase family protein [Streptomyces sp. NPDC003077]|uniref:aminoglycoside phosphotransferase family protein n=1 Tax=Streptomyces sp. NPDC003077 TaxID=3154443 RepID=UPI0033B720A1